MKLDKPHGYSQEEAVARIRALTDYWDTKHGTRTVWDGNRAHIKGRVKGISFDGTFSVLDNRLDAEVKVGFLAEKIGGKSYVLRKLDDYLDPNNSLEELRSRVPGYRPSS
jgi:hypothetical protein